MIQKKKPLDGERRGILWEYLNIKQNTDPGDQGRLSRDVST